MKLTEAIGKRLKDLLKEQGMTQYKLSTSSGVPQTTISSIVNAEYGDVKVNTILNICRGLNIELEQFFSDPLFRRETLDDR